MAAMVNWAASILANCSTIRMPQSTETRTASHRRRKGYALSD
jgi:hypothetical protein